MGHGGDLEPLLKDYLKKTSISNYRLGMDNIMSEDEIARQNGFSDSNFLILSKHLE